MRRIVIGFRIVLMGTDPFMAGNGPKNDGWIQACNRACAIIVRSYLTGGFSGGVLEGGNRLRCQFVFMDSRDSAAPEKNWESCLNHLGIFYPTHG